ncbi:MAG: 2-oxo acid dehydrogenase subunit E2 [Planctomycetes bacterium]|nr:2-oxo acid dehydrogenase subunit E2 [Planctomycetota bacterium]
MERGFYCSLSPARRVIVELLHHAQQVPLLSTGKKINVAELGRLRERSEPRFTWSTLFIKAYALAATRHAELRTAYIKYPWPRLYVHPHTVAGILVERDWEGVPTTLLAKLRAPEKMPLTQIASHLQTFQKGHVLLTSSFRQWLRIGRLPWLLRRLIFWHTLHFSGETRAKRFGTCSVSSVGQFGAEQYLPRTPLTSYFTFGPIDAAGDVEIKIIYDHRVMDDGHVARALVSVEEILNNQIRDELQSLQRQAA